LYGIGSSAGEITADHARSAALGLEGRFIPLTPVNCPLAGRTLVFVISGNVDEAPVTISTWDKPLVAQRK
jgi:hypothetical protein